MDRQWEETQSWGTKFAAVMEMEDDQGRSYIAIRPYSQDRSGKLIFRDMVTGKKDREFFVR